MITGAGRGIGKRLALGFAAAGARVGLVARSKPELELTKLEIKHAGGSALHLRADVTDADSIRSAADRLRAHAGEIGVLVCAAAIQGRSVPGRNPATAWTETITTNLVGVMHSVAAVLPAMIKLRSGKIIVLSGGSAGNRARTSRPMRRPRRGGTDGGVPGRDRAGRTSGQLLFARRRY
jgi:3-oxoacyl-[acyl-carrier protein] reductase